MNDSDSSDSNLGRRDDNNAGSLLVVNLRGLVNTRTPVRKTLEQLKLLRRFNATIVPNNEMFRGMLQSAKEHVAWCKLEASVTERLLTNKLEIANGRKVNESQLINMGGFSSFSDLASRLVSGKTRLDGSQGFRSFFRLNPPRGGFRVSTRRQYGEGGVLGPNRDLLKLVENMI